MHDTDQLPSAWQQRFAFYRSHGPPSSTPQARAAFRALPFGTKWRLNANLLTFLFGPLYFFAKGMWRKGLTLLGAALALGVTGVLLEVPEPIDRAASLVIPAIAMSTANYAYFLHLVKGSRSWNPYEGFGRRSTVAA